MSPDAGPAPEPPVTPLVFPDEPFRGTRPTPAARAQLPGAPCRRASSWPTACRCSWSSDGPSRTSAGTLTFPTGSMIGSPGQGGAGLAVSERLVPGQPPRCTARIASRCWPTRVPASTCSASTGNVAWSGERPAPGPQRHGRPVDGPVPRAGPHPVGLRRHPARPGQLAGGRPQPDPRRHRLPGVQPAVLGPAAPLQPGDHHRFAAGDHPGRLQGLLRPGGAADGGEAVRVGRPQPGRGDGGVRPAGHPAGRGNPGDAAAAPGPGHRAASSSSTRPAPRNRSSPSAATGRSARRPTSTPPR